MLIGIKAYTASTRKEEWLPLQVNILAGVNSRSRRADKAT